LPIALRQNHDAKRFNPTPKTREIGSVINQHRQCGRFVAKVFQHQLGSPSLQHGQQFLPIHTFMLD
jgi:hypothetical protein